MNEERFDGLMKSVEALTDIDDALLSEALEKGSKRRAFPLAAVGIAAALLAAAVVLLVLIWPNGRGSEHTAHVTTPAPTAEASRAPNGQTPLPEKTYAPSGPDDSDLPEVTPTWFGTPYPASPSAPTGTPAVTGTEHLPTQTPGATQTPGGTGGATQTPAYTPGPTPTATATQYVSETPYATATEQVTATPAGETPYVTSTPRPTPAPTTAPTAEPTATPTPTAAPSPTIEPTPEATDIPVEPTSEPTSAATATPAPSPAPTATPTSQLVFDTLQDFLRAVRNHEEPLLEGITEYYLPASVPAGAELRSVTVKADTVELYYRSGSSTFLRFFWYRDLEASQLESVIAGQAGHWLGDLFVLDKLYARQNYRIFWAEHGKVFGAVLYPTATEEEIVSDCRAIRYAI